MARARALKQMLEEPQAFIMKVFFYLLTLHWISPELGREFKRGEFPLFEVSFTRRPDTGVGSGKTAIMAPGMSGQPRNAPPLGLAVCSRTHRNAAVTDTRARPKRDLALKASFTHPSVTRRLSESWSTLTFGTVTESTPAPVCAQPGPQKHFTGPTTAVSPEHQTVSVKL